MTPNKSSKNKLDIVERFSPCGVNVSYIVKRIVAYAPREAITDLRAIEILDYAPGRKGFARYIRDERKIELYVHEIIDWQPRILQKTFIFPYLAIGLAIGHEIDHHVNRNIDMDRETSAETNAMKYIYPSFGILKPVAKIISWFALRKRAKRSILPIGFFKRRKKIHKLIHSLKREPTNSRILEGIEDIGMSKADYRKLITIYLEEIDLPLPATDKAVLHHELAMLFYSLGEWDKAEDNFEKSMSLFEDILEEDIDLLLFKASNFYNLLLLGHAKYGQSAIEQFEKAIERYPDYEQKFGIYMYLANTYNSLAKYEEALSKCSDAINLSSNDLDKTGVYHIMAISYQGMKKYDLAEEYYIKSLKLHGNDKSYFSKVFFDLGKLYIETGEIGKAKETFRKALEYKRYDPLLKYATDYVKEIKTYLKPNNE